MFNLNISPLNPPILGDFELILPQSWGLGGYPKVGGWGAILKLGVGGH
ncbi:hypothetical protein L8106_01687 [Lyngbya sp. PCC 8106]|nr:hypothetical protein L8106_01687 [Lyngbya sp. PCC 8106]